MKKQNSLMLIFLIFLCQDTCYATTIDKGWFKFYAPSHYSIEDNQASTILVLGPNDSSAAPNPFIGIDYQKIKLPKTSLESNNKECEIQKNSFFALLNKDHAIKSEVLPKEITKFTSSQIQMPNSKAELVFFCGKNFTLRIFAVYDLADKNSTDFFNKLIDSFEFK